jgi:hypothetical protein
MTGVVCLAESRWAASHEGARAVPRLQGVVLGPGGAPKSQVPPITVKYACMQSVRGRPRESSHTGSTGRGRYGDKPTSPGASSTDTEILLGEACTDWQEQRNRFVRGRSTTPADTAGRPGSSFRHVPTLHQSTHHTQWHTMLTSWT